jgi:double-stranded uracil-DNA glycosylase
MIDASSGFAPISSPSVRVLILGTLPGRVSLQRGEYYAQPRNVFWRIMGDLLEAGPELSYANRTRQLVRMNVALWDVCASAHRLGSLDSSIQIASVVPNDFAAFFEAHSHIRLVCLNGAKAAALYEHLVLPRLSEPVQRIRRERLPSTSPAHASMPYREKLLRWSIVAAECGARSPVGTRKRVSRVIEIA